MPAVYAYSPVLVPRPPDWPPWHQVTGYCLVASPDQKLDSALAEFLLIGDKPVVVTFGSMSCLDSADCLLLKRAVEAVRHLEMRCIVISGWSKLVLPPSKDLFIIQSAPHEVLFPKCCAVIHHAGAGTTARCVLSGIPSVAVPILRWLVFEHQKCVALGRIELTNEIAVWGEKQV